MRSRVAALLVLAALAGCRAGDSTRPENLNGSASFDIKDGSHLNGNADFFFLPPMAANPVGSPNYDATQFDASLTPTVKICPVSGPGACSSVTTTASDGMYKYNWTAPSTSGVSTFRVSVLLGNTTLGYADVKTAPKQADLKNVDAASFVTVMNGQTLPIKFRIEANALCLATGDDCASKIVNLGNGGNVTTEIGDAPAGVIIPPGSGNTTHKITVAQCADLNPRVTDLRTFGPCISVTATPALPPGGLVLPSTVFICAVLQDVANTLSHEQSERVTMHKYDPGVLKALPHAAACGTSTASISSSLKNVYGSLKRGAFMQAGKQAAEMLAPKMLNAAVRRLDVGAGGDALDFSDFQFALPAKLTIVAGDGQTGFVGNALPVNPKVVVTDLGGDIVVGARVRFANDAAACAALAAGVGSNSNSSGEVSDGPWTVALGANTRAACGRGLGGTDNNGPRTGVDPFQPLGTHFGDASNGSEVTVLTGSVSFSATGVAYAYGSELVPFGDGGYTTYGPYPQGTGPDLQPSAWGTLIGTMGSQAPFRENAAGCGPGAVNGPFPLNTEAYIVKTVNAPVNGTLVATIRIDNDIRVWVDGVELTSTIPNTGAPGVYVSPWWKHDNCVTIGPAVVTVPVSAGAHTIAVRALDRGGNAYFDMQVVLNAPTP